MNNTINAVEILLDALQHSLTRSLSDVSDTRSLYNDSAPRDIVAQSTRNFGRELDYASTLHRSLVVAMEQDGALA